MDSPTRSRLDALAGLPGADTTPDGRTPVLEDGRAWDIGPGEAVDKASLHERFGGNSRTRLSPSAATRNVFIFVDAGREETGRWDAGVLHVLGERVRSSKLSPVNRAILGHRHDGRALRVFWRGGDTLVYAGEFEIDSGEPFSLTETGGAGDALERRIVFRLVPVGTIVEDGGARGAPRRRLRLLGGGVRLLHARGPWPPLVLGSCAAIAVTTWGWPSAPVRAAVTTWFLLVCPGMALVRLLPARGTPTRLVIAVATSLALETLVATAMLEAKLWSPSAVLAILIAVTAGAVALDLWTPSRALSLARRRAVLPGWVRR